MKYCLLLLLTFSFVLTSLAQSEKGWKKKKDKKGLKVYVRQSEDSPFKELRMTFTLKASMSSIAQLLQDIEAIPVWVYKCTESKLLKQVSENEEIYYNLFDFPWPMDDRDLVLRNILKQDPITKVIKSESFISDFPYAKTEGVIRIEKTHLWWLFTPKENGLVEVEYYLKSNPGGMIPAWMVNMALDQGPSQTIKRFKKMLEKPKYKNARLKYISELNGNDTKQ